MLVFKVLSLFIVVDYSVIDYWPTLVFKKRKIFIGHTVGKFCIITAEKTVQCIKNNIKKWAIKKKYKQKIKARY